MDNLVITGVSRRSERPSGDVCRGQRVRLGLSARHGIRGRGLMELLVSRSPLGPASRPTIDRKHSENWATVAAVRAAVGVCRGCGPGDTYLIGPDAERAARTFRVRCVAGERLRLACGAADLPADRRRGHDVTIGPVQLIVLGFPEPNFHGQIIAELERLRETGVVNVVDALAVHKDADGNAEVMHLSNLSDEEAIELGSQVGALIGLGIEGEEGMEAGARAGAAAAADGIQVYSDEDAWDVLEDIPNGSAAALLLLEHRWAIPLRDAVASAGGFRISDGFISPLDLIGIGMLTAEEAKELHSQETAAAGRR
jgi:uncharacterized membrane protein